MVVVDVILAKGLLPHTHTQADGVDNLIRKAWATSLCACRNACQKLSLHSRVGRVFRTTRYSFPKM